MMKIILSLPRICIILTAMVFIFSGCTLKNLKPLTQEPSEGRYNSEFPFANASREIETISHSVKKVFCVTYYTTYQFTQEAAITGYHIASGKFLQSAWAILSTTESFSGTATVAGVTENHIALLTCAHIVYAPDTLFSYFSPTRESPIRLIKSISIKQKQEIWIKELAFCGTFSILTMDPVSDIALIGKLCDSVPASVAPLCFHTGKSTELQWGNSIYILGYPMGNLALARGMISNPGSSSDDDFTVDALLNKGFSGGMILAVRDGIPDFELVGMVKSMASKRDHFLKPVSDVPYYGGDLPYEGDLYATPVETIQYGINYIIPMESLTGLYLKNREILLSKGYNLDAFFLSDQ